MVSMTSQDLGQSQWRHHEKDFGYGKKDKGWWVWRYESWRNSTTADTTAGELMEDGLDGVVYLQTSARQWGRRCRRCSARKQIDIRQSGTRVPVNQGFWLLWLHWAFFATDTKANSGRRTGTIEKRFKRKKKQSHTEQMMYFHKVHWMCLPLPPPPSPRRQNQPLLLLLRLREAKDEDCMITYCRLVNSKLCLHLINLSAVYACVFMWKLSNCIARIVWHTCAVITLT